MIILGISGIKRKAHDNGICLVIDGKVIYAEAEERFTRIKHDGAFPFRAMQQAFEIAGIDLKDIDFFATANQNLNTFKWLTSRNHYDFPHLLISLAVSDPLAVIKQAYIMSRNRARLLLSSQLSHLKVPPEKIKIICHQRAHAASAYYASGFKECLTVSLDGVGSTTDNTFIGGASFICQNGKMHRLENIPVYASLGHRYGAVTEALGFTLVDGEGKTMGLAAYGNPNKCYKEILEIFPRFKNGRWFNDKFCWTDYIVTHNKDVFKRTKTGKYLAGLIKKYSPEDVAAATQRALEETILSYFKYLGEKYKIKDFACAGGVFLNVKATKRLLETGLAESLFVQPAANDCGLAMGAALSVYYQHNPMKEFKRMETVALGSEFSDEEIEKVLIEFASHIEYQKVGDIALVCAQRLTQQKVIGWFQGRAEWGPRALGQRSVLADPRNKATKDRINNILKKRDWFMPFAPSILYDKASEYLVSLKDSPFMILADDIKLRKEKDLIAAAHIDNTVRPQTVKKDILPLYYSLIENFYKLTGVPAVLNTSFNRHGLPIVHSPQDAIEHLIWGCVDELAIGPFLVKRRNN